MRRIMAVASSSAAVRAVRHLMKPMDLTAWPGANHSDAQRHREDLQRRQGGKGTVSCAAWREPLH
jgi:hypothetical protein